MKERILRFFLGICYICLVAALLITHVQEIAGRLNRTYALLETLALAVFAGIVLTLYIRIKEKQEKEEKMDKGEKPGREGDMKPEKEEESAAVETEDQFARRVEPYGLSGRELEVAWLLYRGYTNRQIGEELFIAETTVKKHVTHIYEKMQIAGRKEFKEKIRNPEGK